MSSYDAEALFPSVPIKDCINVIKERLSADNTLKNRTSLSPDDISDLLHLCLQTTNFKFNNRHHTTNDSGPIGLSLMVTERNYREAACTDETRSLELDDSLEYSPLIDLASVRRIQSVRKK